MATRPERRPRDQDRRGAARCRPVFPFGIGTKAVNLCILIERTDYLISQPRFLHFTLNHYTLVVAAQFVGFIDQAGDLRDFAFAFCDDWLRPTVGEEFFKLPEDERLS